MSATPRMRSSFPTTPRTVRKPNENNNTSSPVRDGASRHKSAQQALSISQSKQDYQPVIPESWIEAPQQRLYALAVFVALWTLRVMDYYALQDTEEQSLWLFMKWVLIDGVFLFGLPALRIPWLEWSSSTMLLLFCAHTFINASLMFQVSLPIGMVFSIAGKGLWGARELAVNENSVSIHSVLHNESLILGRQIIHILPEGSAMLNADRDAFCLDSSITEIRIPLTINSTRPMSIELLRVDLDTQGNETINFNKAQIKAMHKDASRMISYSEHFNEPKTLFLTVKKPGLYSLAKVVDETNLEVSKKHNAHTVVVPCPKVTIESLDTDKCRGELSNLRLEVIGTPPLRVKYHKIINQALQESILESIQPDEFHSPLAKQDQQAMILPNSIDTEWVRTRRIAVPMSEHLGAAGTWAYTIDEVRDGFGNVVAFTGKDQAKQERSRKAPHLHAVIEVHERPVVSLSNSAPLKVAAGRTVELPVKLASSGRGAIAEASYNIDYIFSPAEELSASGDHGGNPRIKSINMKSGSARPQIKEPGLYSLLKVQTEFCSGEVMEPSSILLENPPKPDLMMASQEIFDKCAGRAVGLTVDLDLTGTPPFKVMYSISTLNGRHHETVTEHISGHRGQLMLTPSTAGHYIYRFSEISDAVYHGQSLGGKNLILEQDVKPSAGASFVAANNKAISCIDDQAQLNIATKGEGPFTIEYEVLHGGKRQKFELADISGSHYSFATSPLSDGGEYTFALKSITDGAGCKEFLTDETKINVRHQKPKAAFGRIDGQAHVDILEGKKAQLPLRLVGEAPWIITYRDTAGRERTHRAEHANDKITVDTKGDVELLSVDDAICPGLVDDAANKFQIGWIPRPSMRITSSDLSERKAGLLEQQAVCEGEESAIELLFKGAPPYAVQYSEQVKPLHGVKSPANKELKGLQNNAAFRLDTTQAGLHEYKFSKLEDMNYEHNNKHFTPISVQHEVYERPSAAFVNPGKTYSFCSVQSDGEEVIPVNLHGHPPFDLEIEVRHHGAGKPEIISLNGLATNKHTIRIPHKSLHLGKSSVALRRVSDSRGCSRILDSTVPRVQITVFEAPSIYSLDSSADLCVGQHLSFGLSGVSPYTITYSFEGHERRAVVQGSTFQRLAEKPGTFKILGVQDSASTCRSSSDIVKQIHGLPSARISRGQTSYVDIHEGGTVDILFDFGGVPPFEFTYQRSANAEKGKKKAGKVLDIRSEVSDEHSMRIRASEEGTYELLSIKDRYCAYSKAGGSQGKPEQKKLTY